MDHVKNPRDKLSDDLFKLLLDGGVHDAYMRPWHRIERGLRLNRLRKYIEQISEEHNMTPDEKEALFLFFQKALDKKLLNTLKVVQYDQDKQEIISIKGFDIKRTDGVLKWELTAKKVKSETAKSTPKTAATRKKKVTV
jgi:hypothetical protein